MSARACMLVVEGLSDQAVLSRLLSDHGILVAAVYGLRGKQWIDQRLPAFNEAAKYADWLIVRDLDEDAPCAPELVRQRLPRASKGMVFTVAVRAIEAWLLADREGVAAFLGIAAHHVPRNVEALKDPKRAFLHAARRSRARAIREDIVPAAGSTARVGPGFVTRIAELAAGPWSWRRAAKESESLRKCVSRLARR